MMKHLTYLIVTIFLFSFQTPAKKEYHREFYENGALKAEGWKVQDQKTAYWYNYYPNGNISEKGHFRNNQKEGYWYFYSSDKKLIKEGHFINNKAEKWWIIYDIATNNKKDKVTRKYQYRNNKKNGYCLLYKNNKLFKAEKYIENQKIGEWTDVSSFRKDNPNASL